jgi:hypothetical protein
MRPSWLLVGRLSSSHVEHPVGPQGEDIVFRKYRLTCIRLESKTAALTLSGPKRRSLQVAEQKHPEQQKSLEMRVAELEDKLSKLHITEEEMKAYQRVSALLGCESGIGASTALSPMVCSIIRCLPVPIVRCFIRPICICVCYECGGGCLPGGGAGSAGGGFGSLGM